LQEASITRVTSFKSELCKCSGLYLIGNVTRDIGPVQLANSGVKSFRSFSLVENQGPSHIQFLMSLKCLVDFGNCLTFAYPSHLLPKGFLRFRELVNGATRSDIVVYGSEIPKWFDYQSLGYSITKQLPPVWRDRNWVGFAFCAVYVNRDHSFSNFCNIQFQCASVIRSHNQKKIEGFCSHTYVLEN
jgi:hypothetical protein